MAQLSTTPTPTGLPNNNIQNPKYDRHFMAVITQGGKQTIDPPMSCVI